MKLAYRVYKIERGERIEETTMDQERDAIEYMHDCAFEESTKSTNYLYETWEVQYGDLPEGDSYEYRARLCAKAQKTSILEQIVINAFVKTWAERNKP